MENINFVDALSLVIIFVSAILAYFRGLSREILAILSWIAAALLAFIFAPDINPLINKIPLVSEILRDSCQLSIIISFVTSFILSLIFLSLLIPMLTNIVHQSSLNGLDRLLGLCFGFFRGLLIIIVLIIGYDFVFSDSETTTILTTSKTNTIVFDAKEEFKNYLPETKPQWIINRFDSLMQICHSTESVSFEKITN